jgi:hypothetical protein
MASDQGVGEELGSVRDNKNLVLLSLLQKRTLPIHPR